MLKNLYPAFPVTSCLPYHGTAELHKWYTLQYLSRGRNSMFFFFVLSRFASHPKSRESDEIV